MALERSTRGALCAHLSRGAPGPQGGMAAGGGGGKGTRGSLLGMFSFLQRKRDQVLPQVLNTVQGAGFDTAAYGVGKQRTA